MGNPTEGTPQQVAAVNTYQAIDEAIEAARALAATIARGPGGREVALVITKLQEARLWLSQSDKEV